MFTILRQKIHWLEYVHNERERDREKKKRNDQVASLSHWNMLNIDENFNPYQR